MTIQSSTQIGTTIRNAVAFNIQNWSGKTMNSDSLMQAVQDLFSLLERRRINYVLVGGIALLHYVAGRNTQDLDLLVSLSALERLPELDILSQDSNFARARYGALQVDLLLTHNPLFEHVYHQHVQSERFLDRDMRIASVDGLILLKLYALPALYRQGNFARVGVYENDIATLLHYYHSDLSQLLQELSVYVAENDLQELHAIAEDIQRRIQRFEGKTNAHP